MRPFDQPTQPVRLVGGHLCRVGYWIVMYTGIRAICNRLRAHRGRMPAGAAVLRGRILQVPGLGRMQLRVHPRSRPKSEPSHRHFAMVSARQIQPRVRAALYAYLCATSHFGCGHLELALYEEQGTWTIHGIRNMARANAQRLGWTATAVSLSAADSSGAAQFLGSFVRCLREQNRPVRLAPAEDCVRLSVRPYLIPNNKRAQTLKTLRARYERLHTELAVHSSTQRDVPPVRTSS